MLSHTHSPTQAPTHSLWDRQLSTLDSSGSCLLCGTKPQCITSLSLLASCALATAAMASISGPTYCSPAECQTWKNDKKRTTLVWSRHTSECVSRKNSQEHLTGGWRHRTEAKVVKKHEGTHSTQGTRDFLSSLNFPKIKTRLAADDGVRFLKGPVRWPVRIRMWSLEPWRSLELSFGWLDIIFERSMYFIAVLASMGLHEEMLSMLQQFTSSK